MSADFQYSLYCPRSLKPNYSAAHPRFLLVLSGKSYLVLSQSVFSSEPSSLHAQFVRAVFWTQSRTESGRAGAKCSGSFFCLQGHAGHLDEQGQHQSNGSLLTCFEGGWLQVDCDLAPSVRDKLGFACAA